MLDARSFMISSTLRSQVGFATAVAHARLRLSRLELIGGSGRGTAGRYASAARAFISPRPPLSSWRGEALCGSTGVPRDAGGNLNFGRKKCQLAPSTKTSKHAISQQIRPSYPQTLPPTPYHTLSSSPLSHLPAYHSLSLPPWHPRSPAPRCQGPVFVCFLLYSACLRPPRCVSTGPVWLCVLP
jgi:hypothetical protein